MKFFKILWRKISKIRETEKKQILNEYEKVRRELKPLPIKKPRRTINFEHRDISAI